MTELKVTKIVSMTSLVEGTIGELSIKGDVRVRNNETVESVDSGVVCGANGNQLANFNYYGSNNMNINYQTTDADEVASISSAVGEFVKTVADEPSKVTVVSSTNTTETSAE